MNRRAFFLFVILAVITFKQDVQPILEKRCVECHSMGNDLNLSWFPFEHKESENQNWIVDKILTKVSAPPIKMPPSPRPNLTAAQVKKIRDWKDQGLNP